MTHTAIDLDNLPSEVREVQAAREVRAAREVQEVQEVWVTLEGASR